MAQTLQTNIVINAKANEAGFGQVQAQLENMVQYAQQLSQKIIEFGKESADTYGEFEWNMQSARAYMQNNVGNVENIGKVMENLYTQAVKWADTSMFTTTDVSEAILEAAQAGWDYQQMLDGIPAAMLLAQAGGLKLSESLDMIITAANSTKTPFTSLTQLVDQWIVAASNGTTNIEGLGNAIAQMGATSQFAENSAELLTMLSLLSNYGYTGAKAGTLLRNTMIRLIAPTKSSLDEMAELGFTTEEVNEALGENGEQLQANMKLLQEYGFSAYDTQGNLKSFRQIFAELSAAVYQMNEQDRNSVLKNMFGVRSLSGAMSLMDALAGGWNDIYQGVLNSQGAAQQASDTMMDTQVADLKLLESHFDTLKLKVGAQLTGQIRDFADSIGGFITGLNNMPEEQFSAIVAGLETIAGLGAGLGIAAGAIKIMSSIGVAGGLGLAAIGVAAMVTALNDLKESEYENMFGNMVADEESINAYVKTLGEGFNGAMLEIQGFNTELANIKTNYVTASSALSSVLLTKMLTGSTLSQADKDNLFSLGDAMYGELLNGIQTGTNAQKSFWKYIFGEEDENGYKQVEGVINAGYDEAMAEARRLGEGLRAELTVAFEDDEISEEEYNNILEYMKSYNAAIARATAEAQAEQDLIDAQVALAKSQSLSLESMTGVSSTVTGKRDAGLDELQTQYLTNYYRLLNSGADQATLDAATAAYNARSLEYSQRYDSILMKLWTQGITSSDMGAQYAQLEQMAQDVMGNKMTSSQALSFIYSMGNKQNMYDYISSYVRALGGVEAVSRSIEQYQKNGDTEMVDRLSNLLMMRQLMEKGTFSDVLYNQAMYSADIDHTSFMMKVARVKTLAQEYASANPITFGVTFSYGATHGGTGGSGGTGYMRISEYADGGRATEASIFGEAGAEWAIPEQHTNRTAELLNEARAASGFTWAELLQRTGGMNADTQSTPTTIVYSPTINAADASGVAAELANDKARLEKWWKQMNSRQRMVTFA